MKKALVLAIGLVWLLTAHLSFTNVDVSEAQTAMNRRGDLYGENQGHQMVFNWLDQKGAVEYIIYRSLWPDGPWEELAKVDETVRPGGEKVAIATLDGSFMDLCYKVEAIDAAGVVIHTYAPICVPKFVP